MTQSERTQDRCKNCLAEIKNGVLVHEFWCQDNDVYGFNKRQGSLPIPVFAKDPAKRPGFGRW